MLRFLLPLDFLLPPDFLLPLDLRRGTLAPFFRASFNPIAIACLRLVTFLPDPLFSVPLFRRRIVDLTFFEAPLLYLAMRDSSSAEFRKHRSRQGRQVTYTIAPAFASTVTSMNARN